MLFPTIAALKKFKIVVSAVLLYLWLIFIVLTVCLTYSNNSYQVLFYSC